MELRRAEIPMLSLIEVFYACAKMKHNTQHIKPPLPEYAAFRNSGPWKHENRSCCSPFFDTLSMSLRMWNLEREIKRIGRCEVRYS
jgi:hypothetical protein